MSRVFSMQTDVQTDRQTYMVRLIVAFRHFARLSKKSNRFRFVLETWYFLQLKKWTLIYYLSGTQKAVPWPRPSVSGLSPRKPAFLLEHNIVYVVEKVVPGTTWVFLRILQFSSGSFTPPAPHIRFSSLYHKLIIILRNYGVSERQTSTVDHEANSVLVGTNGMTGRGVKWRSQGCDVL